VKTLKEIIRKHMAIISWILMVVVLVIIGSIEIFNEQRRARDDALQAFHQIEQTLKENEEEIEEIRQEYSRTCLHNVEMTAYMLQLYPSAVDHIEELKRIAEFMEVDEIHIFDTDGRIYAGTCPEYYDFTFDSGEQMNFFKPMLEDRSLELVQEVTPNTAEGKMMQYSAIWSKNGEFIVQVGMEPIRFTQAMAKNELSYIFSLLRIDPAVDYYAIDKESGEIVGSTDLEVVGGKLEDIGLSFDDILAEGKGFHEKVNGVDSFCVFRQIGTIYVGRIMPNHVLYQRIPGNMFFFTLGLLLIVCTLSFAMIWCMDKYVVNGIYGANEKLGRIAGGNLDEAVDIRNSVEFSALSDYINNMVRSLLNNNKKMSYVLSKTNMYIGVYEYHAEMKKVRFTEYIPRIFSLDNEKAEQLASNYHQFREFMEGIFRNPVPQEQGVYSLGGERGRYVKLEEIEEENGVFGVAIDVTEEITKRKKIEVERDMDPLTGLYNRRGLEAQLAELVDEPEKLCYCAMVVADADGLKEINDTYGHEKGDIYLQKIADIIGTVGADKNIAARQGGDEFVLFLYGYEEEGELLEALRMLDFIRKHCLGYLENGLRIPLSFSFGYSLGFKELDYPKMLKEADAKMYEDKRGRKGEKAR